MKLDLANSFKMQKWYLNCRSDAATNRTNAELKILIDNGLRDPDGNKLQAVCYRAP